MNALNPSEIPEGAPDENLDAILRSWRLFAAVAYEAFQDLGRGHLLVVVKEPASTWEYRPSPPCDCHPEAIRKYDPETEIVIMVARPADNTESLYTLSGWPSPREAFLEAQQGDATRVGG